MIYGCSTSSPVFNTTMTQLQPYPNMFWMERDSHPANFIFNYKAWRWACYADSFNDININPNDVLPGCGGESAGVSSYSHYQDFDGISDGESITVNMSIWDGTDYDTTADFVLTCVGMLATYTLSYGVFIGG